MRVFRLHVSGWKFDFHVYSAHRLVMAKDFNLHAVWQFQNPFSSILPWDLIVVDDMKGVLRNYFAGSVPIDLLKKTK